MKSAYDDLLIDATLLNELDLTFVAGMPIEDAYDQRLSRKAGMLTSATFRGANLYGSSSPYHSLFGGMLVTSDVILDYDLGGEKVFSMVGIAGHNITNMHCIVTWSTTNILTPDGGATFTDLSPTMYLTLSEVPITARFVRIQFVTPVSTGILVIGRLMLSSENVSEGIGPSYDRELISTGTREWSVSRQLYGGPRVMYRRLSFTFPDILSPDGHEGMFKDVDVYTAFFTSFDDDCIPEVPLYGAVEEDSVAFTYNNALIYTSRITLSEAF